MAPDGKTLVLIDYWTGAIQTCNLQSGQLGPKRVLGHGDTLLGVAVAPNGKMAYLAALTGSSNSPYGLLPLNLTTGSFGKMIPIPGQLQVQQKILISPDGTMAYLLEGNVSTGSIQPVSLTTGVTGRSIPLVDGPADFTLNPDGKMAYVVGYDNRVTAVNLATRKALKSVKIAQPDKTFFSNKAIRVAPDGKSVYVYTGPSILSLNLQTMKVTSTEPAFTASSTSSNILAIPSDQPPIAAFTSTVQGTTVSLDASSSSSSCAIVAYAWNFGDGTKAITKVPTVQHSYKAKGQYKVTLIETDAAGATVNNPVIYTGQMTLVDAGSASAEASHVIYIQ